MSGSITERASTLPSRARMPPRWTRCSSICGRAFFALSRSVVAKVAAIVSCCRIEKLLLGKREKWKLALFVVENGDSGSSR